MQKFLDDELNLMSGIIIPNIFGLIALIFVSTNGIAQVGGNSVYRSLDIPCSAQVSALGGSYIPVVSNNLEIAIFNPSIIDSVMSDKLSLSYVNYFADVNLGFVAYAKKIKNRTYLASLRYFDAGEFTSTNEAGFDVGKFYSNDMVLSLGTSFFVDTNWTAGTNIKMIYSSLEGYSSIGAAIDLSATYNNPARRFTFVWLLKNVGYQLTAYNEVKEQLPFEFQMGFSKRLKHAPFRFSIMYDNVQKWDLTYSDPSEIISIDPITGERIGGRGFPLGDKFMRHIVAGGEILLTDNFNVRFGYNYRRRQELKIDSKSGTTGISWGFGFKIKRFNLSYARSSYHLAGPSNHFTIGTSLSDWKR